MKLHKEKVALLLVDLQNDFCHPKGTASARGKDVQSFQPALKQMQNLLEMARQIDVPIIHAISEHSEWTSSPTQKERFGRLKQSKSHSYCYPGSWGAEIYHLFQPLPNEKIVTKHRYSAFFHTNIELILRSKKIEQVIIIGLYTNVCVDSTARDAYMRDFSVIIPFDCVSSDDERKHEYALALLQDTFAEVVSSDEIIEQLKQ